MVIIGAALMLVQALRMFSFGIFLIPIATEFSWGRGDLSSAYSIALLVSSFLGILSGRICDKYGPRLLVTFAGLCVAAGFVLMSRIQTIWQVQLVWGLFMGAGGSLFFIPITATIARWFVKRRGLAIALNACGFSLGGVVTAPLCQYLIDGYGWRNAYLVMSVMAVLITVPLAQFLKHSPERAGCMAYGSEPDETPAAKASAAKADFTLKEAVRTGRFWLLGLLEFCFFASLQVVLVHITPYALDNGIPALTAASIVSFISVFSTVGRVATGFLSDKLGGRAVMLASVIAALVALIWLTFAGQVWMFYVFALVFGLAYGGMVPLTSLVPVELFGLTSFGVIIAGLGLVSTTGEAMGAPVAGFIFDATGSYRLAFLICIAVDALATIFGVAILRGGRGKKSSGKNNMPID
jgi:OFA family oxalate/formate antiporter-like MFS transporter